MSDLVGAIEISRILPCPSEPGKIRVNAETSCDVSELLPYLNAVLGRPIYNPAAPALTVNRSGRLITLYPRTVFMAKVRDEADARAQLDWIRSALNDVHARRAEIQPVHERRQRLTELEIYKLLPGTNCESCGRLTCLAFAVELAAGRAGILSCVPLLDGSYQDQRQVLLELLAAAGYEVPDAFRSPERE
ncbi:MAG TPA: (Fe-S)-binding protein [Armatimonadota bacterium]|nr:(Fe-S)-binding protein [Armatimonadota bacterium]